MTIRSGPPSFEARVLRLGSYVEHSPLVVIQSRDGLWWVLDIGHPADIRRHEPGRPVPLDEVETEGLWRGAMMRL